MYKKSFIFTALLSATAAQCCLQFAPDYLPTQASTPLSQSIGNNLQPAPEMELLTQGLSKLRIERKKQKKPKEPASRTIQHLLDN